MSAIPQGTSASGEKPPLTIVIVSVVCWPLMP
jgi:hypothetical protein